MQHSGQSQNVLVLAYILTFVYLKWSWNLIRVCGFQWQGQDVVLVDCMTINLNLYQSMAHTIGSPHAIDKDDIALVWQPATDAVYQLVMTSTIASASSKGHVILDSLICQSTLWQASQTPIPYHYLLIIINYSELMVTYYLASRHGTEAESKVVCLNMLTCMSKFSIINKLLCGR